MRECAKCGKTISESRVYCLKCYNNRKKGKDWFDKNNAFARKRMESEKCDPNDAPYGIRRFDSGESVVRGNYDREEYNADPASVMIKSINWVES
jgi:hypothetical protein